MYGFIPSTFGLLMIHLLLFFGALQINKIIYSHARGESLRSPNCVTGQVPTNVFTENKQHLNEQEPFQLKSDCLGSTSQDTDTRLKNRNGCCLLLSHQLFNLFERNRFILLFFSQQKPAVLSRPGSNERGPRQAPYHKCCATKR